MGLVNYERLST